MKVQLSIIKPITCSASGLELNVKRFVSLAILHKELRKQMLLSLTYLKSRIPCILKIIHDETS
jgi:hypothetical protein